MEYVKTYSISLSEMRNPTGIMLSPTNSTHKLIYLKIYRVYAKLDKKPGVLNLPVVVVYGFELRSIKEISLFRVEVFRLICLN
jgi:type III secretory pathway lipoprotein EscJ